MNFKPGDFALCGFDGRTEMVEIKFSTNFVAGGKLYAVRSLFNDVDHLEFWILEHCLTRVESLTELEKLIYNVDMKT